MEVFHGTATYQGIAIGKIRYLRRSGQQIRQYSVDSVKKEIKRFQKARVRVLEALRFLYDRGLQNLDENETELLKCQIALLEEESFSRAIEGMIYSERVNASYAILTTRDEISRTFSKMEDKVIKNRIRDIKTIADRLIQVTEGIAREENNVSDPFILVGNDLYPTDIMEIDQEKLMAFVSHEGSPVSHTAIIAKTLSIPALIDIQVDNNWEDRLAVVDGYEGVVYLDPDSETLERYEKLRQKDLERKEILRNLRDKEDITLDGQKVKVYANIGSLEDIPSVRECGAGGIGLLRSEFQYLGRENYPRESELYRTYRRVAEIMGDKQVIIRTLDIGADKKAEYMNLPEEENPAMGNRGIRVCLDRKKMFKTQLKAIYRASVYGNLSIMYPMISSMEEVREIKSIVKDVIKGLKKKEIPFKKVQHGIMVETPAAVMIAEDLAKEVDFLSLGTNDLSQYVLAMDRKNPSLKNKYNEHHPAILKMIKMTIDAAHSQGCWAGICGELGGDPEMTKTFLQMGVDVISVVPSGVLPLRKVIRETDLSC